MIVLLNFAKELFSMIKHKPDTNLILRSKTFFFELVNPRLL